MERERERPRMTSQQDFWPGGLDGCCCYQLRQSTQEDEQHIGKEGEELRFRIVERRCLRDSQMAMSKRPYINWRGLELRKDLD